MNVLDRSGKCEVAQYQRTATSGGNCISSGNFSARLITILLTTIAEVKVIKIYRME